jgi:leucyl/phenylalanyl-tRNA---protein transferase
MPLFFLDKEELWFPRLNEMGSDIVATGADLRPERLILAYSMGIYPWYERPRDIFWWCPEERAVLFLDELHVSHSMRNVINKGIFTWTMDQAFDDVMAGCRSGKRIGETWIHEEMAKAYTKLHKMGYCHSVEVWQDGELAGGLYGVSLGNMFFGESMFTLRPNASKFGFIMLCRFLREKNWQFIDCQVANQHTLSFGTRDIPRELFLDLLRVQMKFPTVRGNWGDPKVWDNPVRTPHPW